LGERHGGRGPGGPTQNGGASRWRSVGASKRQQCNERASGGDSYARVGRGRVICKRWWD
jgi:hypothetical protein